MRPGILMPANPEHPHPVSFGGSEGPEARSVLMRLATLGLLLTGALFSVACVSPGMGRGQLSVEGRLMSVSGDPLSDVEMEVLLPRAYGLRAGEVAAGQKMDFSSPRRRLHLKTDEQGRFEGGLGEHSYAAELWVFPPLGAVPAAPPPPAFLVRLPGLSDENYYLCTDQGACIVMRPDGSEIPMSESLLASAQATSETISSPAPGSATRARFTLVMKANGDRPVAGQGR